MKSLFDYPGEAVTSSGRAVFNIQIRFCNFHSNRKSDRFVEIRTDTNRLTGNNLSNTSLYFDSPEHAVDEIKKLLLAEDWLTLSRYYDLSNTKTDVKLSDLQSGEYFIRKEEPEAKHPGINWIYKHPFDPGFEFNNIVELFDDAITVFVRKEMEDGFDEPVVALQFFEMVKKEKGYQMIIGI